MPIVIPKEKVEKYERLISVYLQNEERIHELQSENEALKQATEKVLSGIHPMLEDEFESFRDALQDYWNQTEHD